MLMQIIVELCRCDETRLGEPWEIWKAFANGFRTSFCNGLFKEVWKKITMFHLNKFGQVFTK